MHRRRVRRAAVPDGSPRALAHLQLSMNRRRRCERAASRGGGRGSGPRRVGRGGRRGGSWSHRPRRRQRGHVINTRAASTRGIMHRLREALAARRLVIEGAPSNGFRPSLHAKPHPAALLRAMVEWHQPGTKGVLGLGPRYVTRLGLVGKGVGARPRLKRRGHCEPASAAAANVQQPAQVHGGSARIRSACAHKPVWNIDPLAAEVCGEQKQLFDAAARQRPERRAPCTRTRR